MHSYEINVIVIMIELFKTWVSKLIRIYFGFALLYWAIGLKKSRYFVIQPGVQPKPVVTR